MRVVLSIATLLIGMPATAGHWPQWRGPNGDSVAPDADLPLKWSDTENIAWKATLPGQGASTPIIWDDAIFITAQDGENLLLLKVNKRTGQTEWTRTVGREMTPRGPMKQKHGNERSRQRFHELHNLASPSPVTDGERVIVHFGNGDLVAYNFAGQQLWNRNLQKDHGPYTIWWGHANSPVLCGDVVISVCIQDSLADVTGKPSESYVIAHDKVTGNEVWKSLRMTNASAEECDSYITPVIRNNGDQDEVIVVGGDTMDAYDPATGKQRWELAGIAKSRIITGPTVSNRQVFATRGMRGDLFAVRPSGTGKLLSNAVTWKFGKGTPDSCCPVVCNGLIFWVSDDGVARCHDALSGEPKWAERLGTDFKASPLAACGRIYFLDRNGKCTVVAADAAFTKLAENRLDDEVIASPAVSNGRVYLRGKKALYCIGEK